MKSVKYRFIEFFVFDYGSLPYLLSLFFWSGVTLTMVPFLIYCHCFSGQELLFLKLLLIKSLPYGN